MQTETWRPVPGFGGHYEASNIGRVRVLPRTIVRKHPSGKVREFFYGGRILSPNRRSKTEHLCVTIAQDGMEKTVFVHRMVLMAFVGLPPEGCVACHGNGDASDNRIENLRWDTVAANNGDRKSHGRYAVGEKHHMAKLDIATVNAIRGSGLSCTEASRKFKISRSQASRIIRGQSWKTELSCLNDVIRSMKHAG